MKSAISICLLLVLCGCYGHKRQQTLFSWESKPLRIEVIYSGRPEANDGKVVINWYQGDYGLTGYYLLYDHLEYPEETGIENVSYDEQNHILSLWIRSRELSGILRIPITITTGHPEAFVKKNEAIFTRHAAPNGQGPAAEMDVPSSKSSQ